MTNRLADETSPYLRQHRDNPVDWYPWGDEAFERARADDRPIFLSVGYSSCHWCHVMAHESFEDPETAALMNRLFVNVKVDREERPDVDSVYMDAVQAMTGRGGWPMSVFLTPDGRPFYAGTYFPPDDRHGLPSFRRVLEAVARTWDERRDDVLAQAERLRAALGEATSVRPDAPSTPGAVDPTIFPRARRVLAERFDPDHGGFGGAPKFPPAATLTFLARSAVSDPDPQALQMLRTTLDAMAAGGIHDQIGGGFARYSVDERWLVPHFEKMLYDQAGLVRAYLHGYLVAGETRWRDVVEDTIGYVLRDLRSPEGGFWSAEDADSEGEEGRFYLWDADEIRAVCGDDADQVMRYYGVTERGSFAGRNILHVVDRTRTAPDAVRRCRPRLLAARARRVRPGLDDKVLLEWNALFLRALAEAADALERPEWLHQARTTARFLLSDLRRDDGRLLRSWQAAAEPRAGTGRARHLAYAADYAALLEALVTLAEVDDPRWLDDARSVADGLLALFLDPEGGGFFTTGSDAEELVVRPRDLTDGASPGPSSLAANGLLRLAALTGDDSYAAPARRIVEMLAEPAATEPRAFGYLFEAIERVVHAPLEIAIVGPRDDPRTRALERETAGRLLPAAVRVVAPPDRGAQHTPLLESRGLVAGAPAAYVCERFACRRPVTDPGALRDEIDAALESRRVDQPA